MCAFQLEACSVVVLKQNPLGHGSRGLVIVSVLMGCYLAGLVEAAGLAMLSRMSVSAWMFFIL